MLTPLELAGYPIASIATLCDRASTLAPATTVDFLQQLLTRMTPPYPQALAAAIDSFLLENRELREENAALKGAIAELKNPKHYSILGDK
jgi:ABC-type antimicrobial peptide transport system ATPase subunit